MEPLRFNLKSSKQTEDPKEIYGPLALPTNVCAKIGSNEDPGMKDACLARKT